LDIISKKLVLNLESNLGALFQHTYIQQEIPFSIFLKMGVSKQ